MTLQEDPYDGETAVTHRPTLKKKAKIGDIELARRRSTLAKLMAFTDGRELVWWLLDKCHVGKTSACLSANGFDAHGTFFNEGARSIGILLNDEIMAAAPERYSLMLQEEQERQELRKANGA